MKVIGVGFGRTGTMSLKAALERLGAGPCFHMIDLIVGEGKDRDLPYWVRVEGTPHLIIPYTLEVNDMKFGVAPGYTAGDGWLQAMKDSFDVLYAEGARSPKMMSIGLHCRLVGRPSRAATLARFLDYVASKPKVWVATREEIARHWMKVHPAV